MKTRLTHGGALSTRLLEEEEFRGYRQAWNDLLEESGSESFFLRWEWLYTFWETREARDAELQVWLVHDGDRLVGIAPLYVSDASFLKIPVRKMAFLGDRVASDYMDILAAPGYEEACCREVMQRLLSRATASFDVLDLEGLCADSNLYRYLAAGNDDRRFAHILPRYDCPRALLGASFEEYTDRLSASTRYALGRKQRKLEREIGEPGIRHLDLKDRPQMLDVLFELHEKRWNAIGNRDSTFNTSYRKRFNHRLLQHLGEGDGFFSCMSIGDRPVSILYIFVYKNNAYFYQNGWDPAYADYGIGLLNIRLAIRHAIGAGYRSFDFLRGEEEYKYRFCADGRMAYSALLFGNGFRGRVALSLFLVREGLKTVYTRLRGFRDRLTGPRGNQYCLQGRCN